MRKYQREMGKVFEEGLEWNFKEDLKKKNTLYACMKFSNKNLKNCE